MSCDEFVELVTAYLDGELNDADERRFVEHLTECDGCGRYLDQIRQTLRALGSLPAESLPAPARDRLLAAFRGFARS